MKRIHALDSLIEFELEGFEEIDIKIQRLGNRIIRKLIMIIESTHNDRIFLVIERRLQNDLRASAK